MKFKKNPTIGTVFIKGRQLGDNDIIEGNDKTFIELVKAGILIPVVEEKKDTKKEVKKEGKEKKEEKEG